MRVRRSRLLFQSESEESVQKAFLCPFHWKPRPSGVSLECPGLENIAKILENRAEVAQNDGARKAVSPTLWVLKWSGAIFHLRSSKINVQKVLPCSFHCKPRPSGVSLDYSGLENIAQVRGNRAEFCQNHDVRKAVSATLWFFKWTGTIFRPRS